MKCKLKERLLAACGRFLVRGRGVSGWLEPLRFRLALRAFQNEAAREAMLVESARRDIPELERQYTAHPCDLSNVKDLADAYASVGEREKADIFYRIFMKSAWGDDCTSPRH